MVLIARPRSAAVGAKGLKFSKGAFLVLVESDDSDAAYPASRPGAADIRSAGSAGVFRSRPKSLEMVGL
jgi:hypothetical protein